MNENPNQDKVNELLEKAKRGVLQHLVDEGGSATLEDLHNFSLKTFFIQHQRFSKMMEDHVDEKYVEFDAEKQEFMVTDAGKDFVNT